MEDEVLVNALGDTLAEADAKALSNTLLVHALGYMPAKVKAETVSGTLVEVKAQPLVDALTGTL